MEDKAAKERIIKATIEIADEAERIDRITVRQIADKAGVGIGLINYYFRSKDNLLRTVVGELMNDMAAGLFDDEAFKSLTPKERLKELLKRLFTFGMGHEKLTRFALVQGMITGDHNAALFLVPVLREIFGNTADEIRLRIMAAQIIMPLQSFSVNPTEFRMYSGMDLRIESDQHRLIDMLVDQVIERS